MTAIKVNRLALIQGLENAKAEMLKTADALAKEWEAYDKAVQDWGVKAFKQAKTSDISTESSYRNDTIVIRTKLKRPEAPGQARPDQTRYQRHLNKWQSVSLNEVTRDKVEQIDNTLKLLKMSNEENVNASVYKSVAQYL